MEMTTNSQKILKYFFLTQDLLWRTFCRFYFFGISTFSSKRIFYRPFCCTCLFIYSTSIDLRAPPSNLLVDPIRNACIGPYEFSRKNEFLIFENTSDKIFGRFPK